MAATGTEKAVTLLFPSKIYFIQCSLRTGVYRLQCSYILVLILVILAAPGSFLNYLVNGAGEGNRPDIREDIVLFLPVGREGCKCSEERWGTDCSQITTSRRQLPVRRKAAKCYK